MSKKKKKEIGEVKEVHQHGLKHALENTPQYLLDPLRPVPVESPEVASLIINTYLTRCYQYKMMPQSQDIQLELGLTDKTWEEYKKDERFTHIFLRTEKIVEKYLEIQLRYGNNPYGALAALKAKHPEWQEKKKAPSGSKSISFEEQMRQIRNKSDSTVIEIHSRKTVKEITNDSEGV